MARPPRCASPLLPPAAAVLLRLADWCRLGPEAAGLPAGSEPRDEYLGHHHMMSHAGLAWLERGVDILTTLPVQLRSDLLTATLSLYIPRMVCFNKLHVSPDALRACILHNSKRSSREGWVGGHTCCGGITVVTDDTSPGGAATERVSKVGRTHVLRAIRTRHRPLESPASWAHRMPASCPRSALHPSDQRVFRRNYARFSAPVLP